MRFNLNMAIVLFATGSQLAGCGNEQEKKSEIRLLTLDPGHFHAALVQKENLPGIDTNVYVYAPSGPDLQQHLNRIEAYNTRAESPTHWNPLVYTGADFLDRMIQEKRGNVVILAGNNGLKTDYILRSVQAGFNVLADKPMAIDVQGYVKLKEAFSIASEQQVLLYDIMTERFEITTILQKELSHIPAIFGTLEKGSPENPAVTKESVHHFYKFVSGKALTRPDWFFDVKQQGEGIVDVTTHLVDLVQWECFPEEIIDMDRDIRMVSAIRFPTPITASQFEEVTGEKAFPSFLQKDVLADSILQVFANGEIVYQLHGVYVKVSVRWAYKAPEGGGDTHYSMMRGTKANLVIRQSAEEKYKPVLYIIPSADTAGFEKTLQTAIEPVLKKYPGVELLRTGEAWMLEVPDKYREGHEAHFARVMQNFTLYFREGNMPAWEVPNMLAKYYITTTALSMASTLPADPAGK